VFNKKHAKMNVIGCRWAKWFKLGDTLWNMCYSNLWLVLHFTGI